MTGRIITAADSDFPAIESGPRAARSAVGKLITVPISLPPPQRSDAATRLLRDLRRTRLTVR